MQIECSFISPAGVNEKKLWVTSRMECINAYAACLRPRQRNLLSKGFNYLVLTALLGVKAGKNVKVSVLHNINFCLDYGCSSSGMLHSAIVPGMRSSLTRRMLRRTRVAAVTW